MRRCCQKTAILHRVLMPVTFVVSAFILFFVFYLLFPHLPYSFRSFISQETPITACTLNTNALAESCPAADGEPRIPNIVNLVFVLKDPKTSDYPIQFSHYMSLFAVWWRLQPDIIYLHTNTSPESPAVKKAKDGSAGKWSKLFFAIPGLTINEITVPTRANNGVTIKSMEHKSDFVRVQTVRDFGGIYIDLDVHILRDIRPLMKTGYGAVVGRQFDNAFNSGTFMSEKEGKLISAWLESMHRVYDGGWVTHSNTALTRTAEKMQRTDPCEILAMGKDSFAPVGWTAKDNRWLFDEHDDDDEEEEEEEEEDALRRYDDEYTWDDAHPQSWALGWSCTFMLHAFSFKKPRHGYKSNGITPGYVLRRKSNFARATYATAKELYDRGIITMDEED